MAKNIAAPDEVTIEGLENLYEQLKEQNIKRAATDKELDDYYFNEHKVEVVESPVIGVDPEVLRLGRVPSSMNLIEGLFDQYPVYSIIARGTGVNARREAERVEKFSNAAVRQAERESREDTYGLTTQETLRFGRSFTIELRNDAAAWSEYPEQDEDDSDEDYNENTEDYKKTAEFPVSIRHVAISPDVGGISALPLMAGNKMIRFMRVTKMDVTEIVKRFGTKGQGRHPEQAMRLRDMCKDVSGGREGGLTLTDQVTVVEYYDDKRVVYAGLDDKFKGIFREWEHGQGGLPVTLCDGIVTGDPKPERRWKSVYHDARDVVLHEDRLASRQATNVRINYYKSFYALADETGVAAGKQETLEFEPGKLTVLQGIKQFGAVDTETASKEADSLGAKIERMLERHLLPSVLMGVQGSHDEPAWGTNLRIRQAEKRYKRIGNHLASARVGTLKNIFRSVIAIGERVYALDDDDVEWSITPEEAKKYINRIRVKIEPKTIIDRNADVQAAQGMYELGFPKRVVIEDVMGYEQPVELMRERILEDIQFDPRSPLYQRMVEDILRQAQLLKEKEETASDEEIAAAYPEVGPGAAALLERIRGGPEGAVPASYVPTGGRPMSPPEQAQMKTGRRQGRQPRPRQAPRSVRRTGG
jgi:hypothetical protein